MHAPVAAWLADCRAPAPSAVDLAVHVAQTTDRDGLLRLAIIATNLDVKLRTARRAAEIGTAQAAQFKAAMSSASHSAVVAIERIQEAEPVLQAALAWLESPDDGLQALATAAEEYRDKVKARS